MKKQAKTSIRVPNVRIGGAICAVQFKVNRNKKFVKCSTKGQQPFFIRQDGSRFVAGNRGNEDNVTAGHPAQAFAKAVKEFWTMW